MQTGKQSQPKGRGSSINPPNRFERVRVEEDDEHFLPNDDGEFPARSLRTEFIPDRSKTIVSENDSPDVGFRYSLNPYRGWTGWHHHTALSLLAIRSSCSFL